MPTGLPVPLRSPKGDMEILRVTERDAFMTWRIVDGRPPAFSAFLERTVGGDVTTRFFGTAAKTLEAARKG